MERYVFVCMWVIWKEECKYKMYSFCRLQSFRRRWRMCHWHQLQKEDGIFRRMLLLLCRVLASSELLSMRIGSIEKQPLTQYSEMEVHQNKWATLWWNTHSARPLLIITHPHASMETRHRTRETLSVVNSLPWKYEQGAMLMRWQFLVTFVFSSEVVVHF